MNKVLEKALTAALLIASFLTLTAAVSACGTGEADQPPYFDTADYYGSPNTRQLPWYKAHAAETHRGKRLALADDHG